MLYVGIDLGKRRSQIAVVDDKGEVISQTRIRNNKEKLQKYLKRLGEPAEVLCETSTKSFWLHDILDEVGTKVHVAHAYKVKLITESKRKTDKIDAGILGKLLQADFYPEVYVPSKDIRMWKEVMRSRGNMIRMRSESYNRIHAIIDRNGTEYNASEIHGKTGRSWIEGLDFPEPTMNTLREYMDLVEEITAHIKVFEKELKANIKLDKEAREIVKRLETIPGIGWLTAMTLYLELADIERFANTKKLCSYIGIVPGIHQSGDVQRGGRLTKQGNSILRCLLVENAWIACYRNKYYYSLHQRHSKKIGRTRAILPVARAILYAVFKVWKEGKNYKEIFESNNRAG